jgi:P-type Cu+ transporter
MNTEKENISLKITGMTCVNCAVSVEHSVKKLGVEDAAVNFATRELFVSGLNGKEEKELVSAIEKAGYGVEKDDAGYKNLIENILLYGVFGIAAYFMIQMFFHWHSPLADMILATFVIITGFYKFGRGAMHSVVNLSANMYVLVLMGAGAAYFFSIYLTFFQAGEHLYFEAAAVIIALVMLGKKIEEKSIEKTTSAISGLAGISIHKAQKIIKGEAKTVSINEVRVNDMVVVNSGDYIPTDGMVESGNGMANESLLTGESEPLYKSMGDTVLGGSILNDGNIVYKVTRPGYESTLAQINRLVQKAANEKADIQKYADKVSSVFVPGIVLIAVLWFLFSYFVLGLTTETALIRSITILVVSCPCAMGLATPIAIMVGLGKMSEKGILIKRAQAVENFARIKHLILDKTGTLTTGKFQMSKLTVWEGQEDEWLGIIKAMEQKSSHPIALSVVHQLENISAAELLKTEEIKGSGLTAEDAAGNTYRLGNASFCETTNDEFDIFLVKNKQLVAAFNIHDEIKEGTKQTLQYFTQQKIESIVLSGDNRKKCQLLSEALNITAVDSLKPDDKLSYIDENYTEATAMLGDGVNDAPSLSKVNVGISFGHASSIAVQASDIVLMRDKFSLLSTAHKLSVQTVKTIRQNLFWAFSYNIVAIPMAAMGIFTPMMAAFLMLFSSLVVVGNSYLLKLKKF